MATSNIYWPKAPEYALPWAAGPALYVLLAVFDLPSGKPLGLGAVPTTLGGYLMAFIFLLPLNALFLWIHLRSQFLTWRSGRRRFVGTFILLTAGHLVAWGVVQAIRGHVRPVHGERDVDWARTVEQIDLALLGFTVVLLVTAIWKTEEPGVSNLRLERENARRLIGMLMEGTLQADDFRDLEPTLKQLEESARPLAARLSGADLDLLRLWRTAAHDVLAQIEGKDLNDMARLREEANVTLTKARVNLSLG